MVTSVRQQSKMRKIPRKLREQLANDPYYKRCSRESHECNGRITWEHVWIYAGRQINEWWAIIPLCWFHHLGAGLNKKINEKISLQRSKLSDYEKYPKKDWVELRRANGLTD